MEKKFLFHTCIDVEECDIKGVDRFVDSGKKKLEELECGKSSYI